MTNPSSGSLTPLIRPTECYAEGCTRENEFLIHIQPEPADRYADVCAAHAVDLLRYPVPQRLMPECGCAFCLPLRTQMIWSIAVGGRWEITTASGSRYLIDLDAHTLMRIHDETDWNDPDPQGYVSVTLRRDGEALPLLAVAVPVRVGHRASFKLDEVDTYDGYSHTTRTTTPITAIRRLPDNRKSE